VLFSYLKKVLSLLDNSYKSKKFIYIILFTLLVWGKIMVYSEKLIDKIKNSWNNIQANTVSKISATLAVPLIAFSLHAQSPSEVRSFQKDFENKPKIEQADLVYDWFWNFHDDSLEMAILGNNKLYHVSNAALQTKPSSGIGSIIPLTIESLDIYEEPFVRITMTGKSGSVFSNEVSFKRDYTTTFPSTFNALNIPDKYVKAVLNLYAGWEPDHVIINKDENDKVLNIDYKGPSNRHLVVKRQVSSGEQVNVVDHAKWEPGTHIYVPLSNVLQFMGYDLSLIEQVRSESSSDTEYINNLTNLIKDCNEEKDELNDLNKKLIQKADSLNKKSDSLTKENSSLQNFIKKLEGGPGVFVSNNGEFSYALNVGLGVGKKNNTFSLLGIYVPGVVSQQSENPTISYLEKYLSNFGITAVSKDVLEKSSTINKSGAVLFAGYEIFDNFSLLAGLAHNKEAITNVSKNISETYFLSTDNVVYDHDLRVEEFVTEDISKKFGPAFGIAYNLGPLKASVFYNNNTKEVNVGLIYNMLRNRKPSEKKLAEKEDSLSESYKEDSL